MTEDDLLRPPAGEQDRHLGLELLARREVAIVGRALDGVPERADAGGMMEILCTGSQPAA